ncbi:MAG: 16S rRNA (cytidine(1402)-2'-O)-methyltransferase [Chloroflexi bacterium]|nr:16S rRNA (cytidine(1402)-2'-O)-methyltransferase [Chloroflexota bacterium]
MGTLFVVGTPIGNLRDITLRALEVLRSVSLIAAEDTRVTRKLLAHYDIHTPLTSYFEHNKLQKVDVILRTLAEGDVALVSDAGMPGINDPGYELIQAVIRAGYPLRVVPGPSAPIAALVISGLPTDRFLYLGYVPRRSGERRRLFQDVRDVQPTLLFLEVPHRLVATLEEAMAVWGPERRCAVARELTKVHEEVVRGTLADVYAHFQAHPPRGELVWVVEGARESQGEALTQAYALAETLIREGMSPSRAARVAAQAFDVSRRAVYEKVKDGAP